MRDPERDDGGAREKEEWGPAPSFGGCAGCGRPYSDDGFMDFIVPNGVWAKISPTGDSGGLLCPGCIISCVIQADISRVNDGSDFVGTFESGPLVGQSLHFNKTPRHSSTPTPMGEPEGERIAWEWCCPNGHKGLVYDDAGVDAMCEPCWLNNRSKYPVTFYALGIAAYFTQDDG